MTMIHSGHSHNGRGDATSPVRQIVSFLRTHLPRLAGRMGHAPLPAHSGDEKDRRQQRRQLEQLTAGRNREVYIVGGGPSVKDIDLAQLADQAVIAVNYAIFSLPNATCFVTLDPRFFTKIQDRLEEFDRHPAYKVLVHNWATDRTVIRPDRLTVGPTTADFSDFPLIIRSTVADGFGRSFLDFRHGANSGYCAVQLALLLGYERIHLLGFDLSVGPNGEHYHDAYQLDRNCLPSYIRHFRDGLQSLAADWPSVRVISHSPVSVLNDLIPYEPLKL